MFFGDNLVSWSSKRQNTVSRSSAEAEYRAVANGVTEAAWLRHLLQELHAPLHRATLVYCDNISAVYMSSNLIQRQRTKHIEIDLHFVRERVAVGDVCVHVSSFFSLHGVQVQSERAQWLTIRLRGCVSVRLIGLLATWAKAPRAVIVGGLVLGKDPPDRALIYKPQVIIAYILYIPCTPDNQSTIIPKPYLLSWYQESGLSP